MKSFPIMQMNTHEQAMVITRVVPAIPCPHLHGRTPAQSSRLRSAGCLAPHNYHVSSTRSSLTAPHSLTRPDAVTLCLHPGRRSNQHDTRSGPMGPPRPKTTGWLQNALALCRLDCLLSPRRLQKMRSKDSAHHRLALLLSCCLHARLERRYECVIYHCELSSRF